MTGPDFDALAGLIEQLRRRAADRARARHDPSGKAGELDAIRHETRVLPRLLLECVARLPRPAILDALAAAAVASRAIDAVDRDAFRADAAVLLYPSLPVDTP